MLQIRRNRNSKSWMWISLLIVGVLVGVLAGKASVSQTPIPEPIKIEVIKKDTVRDTVIVRDTIIKKVSAGIPPLNDRTLMAELKRNGVQKPHIVLAQAKLETGNYSSKVCRTHNNLFGLRKGNRYRAYSNWTESVKAYKNLIQDGRYGGGDYYAFLKRIGYAEDPQYIDKLKTFV